MEEFEMENMFSFKDLEKVRIKATYNMKIGDREILEGETIALFDKIQISNFKEISSKVSANGGFDNRARVFWNTTEKVQLNFAQGVFSKEQFSLMINARMIGPTNSQSVLITEQEELESNEEGKFELKYKPVKDLFIYNKETGSKISEYTINEKEIILEAPFTDVIVTYVYEYKNSNIEYLIGQNVLTGFVELEGRTRIKDDTTGQVVTGILKIPHLRLMSDLSIRLGAQATPMVGNFVAEGIPVGSRGNTYVSEFFILGDDIESDL